MVGATLGLSLLMVLAGGPVAGPAFAGTDEPSIEVPGGAAALARTLGLREDLPRSRLLLTAARVLWENPEGADRESDLRRARALEHLRRVDGLPTVGVDGHGDLVPSFIPPGTWLTLLSDLTPARSTVFAGILGDRRMALLYHGLASLDRPTRDYLVRHPHLLRALSEDERVGLFATYGRSLRVRDDVVQVPGGDEAAALWENVAGERPANAAAFIQRVLSKDNGRLALLYDGIAHLTPGGQRFALGLNLPPPARLQRFRAFYDATENALGNWQPRRRPFHRETFDAVHLLLSVKFGPNGEVSGPPWPGFWRAAFDGFALPAQWPHAGAFDAEPPLDAAGLLEFVSVADGEERVRRSESWLFAHRAFPQPAPGTARDVLIAVRGFCSYPALLLTLERMGVQDPTTYAAAVEAAERLRDADGRLWQFQAALAIVERAWAARSIERAAVETLVRKLSAPAITGAAAPAGAVARWLEQDFLGTVPESLLSPEMPIGRAPIEARVLAAMAGSVASPANRRLLALPPLEWEGLRYRVDPGQATLQRLLQIRQRQRGRSLDVVLDFARLADGIANASSAAIARENARQLQDAASALKHPPRSGGSRRRTGPDEPDAVARAARARERAEKLSANPDRRTLAEIARPLQESADALLADVLGSIAYAPHLAGPDSPPLMAGDPAEVHDFRFFKPGTELGKRTAWQTPVEARDADVGWHVSGSLLCLDFAMARFSLPRLPAESLPDAPTLPMVERQTFTESAFALTAFDLTEEARTSLVAAVERGRRRLASLDGSSRSDVERLAADAQVDEWRAQALAWTMGREPDSRYDVFSLAELARVGGLDATTADWLDCWGTAGLGTGRGAVASYPDTRAWSTLAGRHGPRSAVAALVPDLAIGMAEASARAGLPAALTAGLVAVATLKFTETVRVAHTDDWPAMVAFAHSVVRNHLDDCVAVLTVVGPLVPETD